MIAQPDLFQVGRLPDHKHRGHAHVVPGGTGIGRNRRYFGKRHIGLKAAAAALELGRPCDRASAPMSGRRSDERL